MKLDRIDIRILHELQQNGRLINVELTELVHLSPRPCLMRVKKLQKFDYITGFSAHVDIAKLGPTVMVFTEVTLRNHCPSDFARFQLAIERVDQDMERHLISGGYDYLLKFVNCSISDYQETMEDFFAAEIGIDKCFCFVVMKTPFVKHHMPLKEMFSEAR